MKYQAEKGKRIKSSRFRDILPGRKERLWWLQYYDNSGEWLNKDQEKPIWDEKGNLKSEYKDKRIWYLSNSGPKVTSLRAFRRRLKEYSEYLPKGTEFILMSRYIGHDIIGRTK